MIKKKETDRGKRDEERGMGRGRRKQGEERTGRNEGERVTHTDIADDQVLKVNHL